MASVVECKNKNGTTYLYSNVTIWNKENKKYKYKREVIGKIDSSGKKIMYNKKPVNLPTPKASKSYGNIYFLEQVANNIGLTDILKNIFKDEYDVLITLVHYIICVDSSLSNSIKWMELTETVLKTELSSQYISSFIKKIDENIILSFFKQWSKKDWNTNILHLILHQFLHIQN